MPAVAMAEIKGVMPQADPHFYAHSGDGHGEPHGVPTYQQDAYVQGAAPAEADAGHLQGQGRTPQRALGPQHRELQGAVQHGQIGAPAALHTQGSHQGGAALLRHAQHRLGELEPGPVEQGATVDGLAVPRIAHRCSRRLPRGGEGVREHQGGGVVGHRPVAA